jgi:uridylate kinase
MDITVIKLGGSLVSPSREKLFDFDYLKGLKEKLLPHLQAGRKFFFVLGGGSLMRMYRDLAKDAGVQGENELHLIGTTVNVLNAEVFRAYFAEYADEGVFKYEDYYDDKPIEILKGLKAGGGGRPGHSGDMDATLAALKCQSDTVINLKNIDHIYSADPKKDPNATKINDLTWEQYLELIGNPADHEPGGNYPIDPVTSRLAREKNIKMVVMSGWDLDNFASYLSGNAYEGTLVHN